LFRTRWKLVNRALLASAVGVAGLAGGCTDNKGDGQIKSSPEARNTSQAIVKSYSESMAKKYANQMKKRP
jgi:hypothetical protein